MSFKFYHAQNCNRTVKSGALSFLFSAYEHVGTWMGVLKAKVPEEIAALEKLVSDAKSGITKITEAEYLAAIKKKQAAADSYAPSLAVDNKSPEDLVPSVGHPLDSEPAPQTTETVAPLKSVDEAVAPVPVEPKARKSNA